MARESSDPTAPAVGPSRARSHALLALAGLGVLVLYAFTLAPSVGAGDAGELTVVGCTWGVAHAPGYPILSLLGNLVSSLPLPGEPALPLNVTSALFGALAAWLLGVAVLEWTASAGAALLALAAFATSRYVWSYALVFEVFALNNLFAAALLACMARYARGLREGRAVLWPLPLSALCMSTAITHNLTLALVALPVLAYYLTSVPGLARAVGGSRVKRVALRSVLVGLAGLLPLLYLPLAAAGDPPLNWGDPRDAGGVLHSVLRRDYGAGALVQADTVAGLVLAHGVDSAPGTWRNYGLYWGGIPGEFAWTFVLWPLLGLVWIRRERGFVLFFGLYALLLTVFFRGVNTPLLPEYRAVAERFHILPHLVLSLLAGLGLHAVLERVGKARALVAALAIGVTPGWALLRNFEGADRGGETFTRDYGANLMAGMPPGALVFGMGDLTLGAFHYQQACLGQRPDLTYVHVPKLTYEWHVEDLRGRGTLELPPSMRSYDEADPSTQSAAWFELNLGRRPIVVTEVPDPTWREGFRLDGRGLWSRVRRADEPAGDPSIAPLIDRWMLETEAPPGDDRPWEQAAQHSLARAVVRQGAREEYGLDVAAGRVILDRPRVQPRFELAGALLGGAEGEVAAQRAVDYAEMHAMDTAWQRTFSAPGPLRQKIAALSRRAEELRPGDARVLTAWMSLNRRDRPDYDLAREIELRQGLLDAKPGERAYLGAYLQLLDAVVSRPLPPGLRWTKTELVRDACRRLEVFLERLELAAEIATSRRPAQEALQWREALRRWRARGG